MPVQSNPKGSAMHAAHGKKIAAFLAVALVALFAMTAVSAASTAKGHKQLFRYSGRLVAAPASDATSIAVSVETGNKRALHSLLGHSQVQNFSVGAKTEYLQWTKGIPHVVALGDLHANDWVTVNVRAAA